MIDSHEDELVSHDRGYGKAKEPEDYIESFKNFIMENLNEIKALQIVCTRPSELTRETLKELKHELDRHDFTEKQLNTARSEMPSFGKTNPLKESHFSTQLACICPAALDKPPFLPLLCHKATPHNLCTVLP